MSNILNTPLSVETTPFSYEDASESFDHIEADWKQFQNENRNELGPWWTPQRRQLNEDIREYRQNLGNAKDKGADTWDNMKENMTHKLEELKQSYTAHVREVS